VAVAIVVDESTTRAPAHTIAPQASLFCDIGERTISIVVQQDVVAPRGNIEVHPTIVVVVTCADPLTPSRQSDASLSGYISEGAISIVVVKVACGPLPIRKTRKSAPIHQEDVRPTIIVIVKKSGATASRLDDIFFSSSSPVTVFAVSPARAAMSTKLTLGGVGTETCGPATLSGLLGKHQASQQQKTHQERCD